MQTYETQVDVFTVQNKTIHFAPQVKTKDTIRAAMTSKCLEKFSLN